MQILKWLLLKVIIFITEEGLWFCKLLLNQLVEGKLQLILLPF